jgi:hypothetical protein
LSASSTKPHAQHLVVARLFELDVRDVDRGRSVRISLHALALELGLDLERLVARRERAAHRPAGERRDVEGRGRVDDLLARAVEQPEAEPVLARLEQ